MTFLRFPIIAICVLLLSATARAEGVKVFEKTAGVWKASCFKEPGDEAPYCRAMVVKVFKDGARTGNFVQFGPAWDRGNTGFVIASYLGFTRESSIRLGIDDQEPWSIAAPMDNHAILPPDVTQSMIDRMTVGKTVRLRFKPATGVKQDLKFPLDGFSGLVEAIQPVLRGETK